MILKELCYVKGSNVTHNPLASLRKFFESKVFAIPWSIIEIIDFKNAQTNPRDACDIEIDFQSNQSLKLDWTLTRLLLDNFNPSLDNHCLATNSIQSISFANVEHNLGVVRQIETFYQRIILFLLLV